MKIYFFPVNTKIISSHVLKISEISLVSCTREFTDSFITFDEIYLVFTLKQKIFCIYLRHHDYFNFNNILLYVISYFQ